MILIIIIIIIELHRNKQITHKLQLKLILLI